VPSATTVGHRCHPRPDLLSLPIPCPSAARISSPTPSSADRRRAQGNDHGAKLRAAIWGWRGATSSGSEAVKAQAARCGLGRHSVGSGGRRAGWRGPVALAAVADGRVAGGGGRWQGGRRRDGRRWAADGWRLGMTSFFFHFSFFSDFLVDLSVGPSPPQQTMPHHR
jgi:hypothetical protein